MTIMEMSDWFAPSLSLTGATLENPNKTTGNVIHIASMLNATQDGVAESAASDWLKGKWGK